MNEYLVVSHVERKIRANNEEEAIENFFEDLEDGNTTPLTTIAECTTAKLVEAELCASGHVQDADGRCKCTNEDGN